MRLAPGQIAAAHAARLRAAVVVLDIQDITGARWRVRRDHVESIVAREFKVREEANGDGVRIVPGVVVRTLSGNDILVRGSLEQWNDVLFGAPRSLLAP